MIPFLFELRKLLHNTLWGSGGAQIRQSYPLDCVTEVGLDWARGISHQKHQSRMVKCTFWFYSNREATKISNLSAIHHKFLHCGIILLLLVIDW